MKILHESQLSLYKKAAQKYYESILKSYDAPPLHSSQTAVSEYINHALSKVQIQQKWYVEYPDVEAWLWNPLRNLLSKWYNTVKTISKKQDDAPLLHQKLSEESTLVNGISRNLKTNELAITDPRKDEDISLDQTAKEDKCSEENNEVLNHESEGEDDDEESDIGEEEEDEDHANSAIENETSTAVGDEIRNKKNLLASNVLLRSQRKQLGANQQPPFSSKRKIVDESTAVKKGKLADETSNVGTRKKSHRGRGRGKGRGRGGK